MNNSLPRLIDGMVAALRNEIIPHVDTEFARGQAFGLIYMLKSIKLRASWSSEFLGGQLAALAAAGEALQDAMPDGSLDALLPRLADAADRAGAQHLEQQRNDGDKAICGVIDWLFENRASLSGDVRERLERVLQDYMSRQIAWEFSNSPKPMLAEMTRGSESDH